MSLRFRALLGTACMVVAFASGACAAESWTRTPSSDGMIVIHARLTDGLRAFNEQAERWGREGRISSWTVSFRTRGTDTEILDGMAAVSIDTNASNSARVLADLKEIGGYLERIASKGVRSASDPVGFTSFEGVAMTAVQASETVVARSWYAVDSADRR